MAVIEAPISQQQQQPGSVDASAARVRLRLMYMDIEAHSAPPPPVLVPGSISLGTLSDPRLRVMVPIHVWLSLDDGEVVAEATDLDEFGFGSNASEAIQDIQRAVVQLYFALEETRDRLGEDLQRTWAALQGMVVRQTTPG